MHTTEVHERVAAVREALAPLGPRPIHAYDSQIRNPGLASAGERRVSDPWSTMTSERYPRLAELGADLRNDDTKALS